MDDLARETLAYLADPQSQPVGSNDLFAKLAMNKPLLRAGSVWIVSRHDLVTKLASNPHCVMRLPDVWAETPDINHSAAAILEQLMPIQPPADHRRLRRLLAAEFSAKAIARLRDRVVPIVHDLFTEPLARGECEFVHDICGPLPVYTTAAMLGLPDSDRPLVFDWARTVNTLILDELGGRVSGTASRRQSSGRTGEAATAAGEHEAAPDSLNEVVRYIEELVDERTRRPGDDIVSRLSQQASAGDGKLSRQELVAVVVMLLLTGIDTVGGALANVVMALDRHREVWQRVVESPSLARQAYSEGIRLLPPTPMASRIAEADIDLGGASIPAGSTVLLMYGAANLDPAVFADPTAFDLDRDDMYHLAFGHGPHFCLGASLAMLQGECVVAALAQKSPAFSVVSGQARRRTELAFHSLAELPLQLAAEPRQRASAEV